MFMTDVAGELWVCRDTHQAGRRPRVRNVACGAARVEIGEIVMAGGKVRLRAGIVTAGAEIAFGELEESRIGATMRQMAGRAIGCRGLVRDLSREVVLVVAAQAELSFRLFEHRRVVGPVRVVTGGAILDSGMPVALCQLFFLLGMAAET